MGRLWSWLGNLGHGCWRIVILICHGFSGWIQGRCLVCIGRHEQIVGTQASVHTAHTRQKSKCEKTESTQV